MYFFKIKHTKRFGIVSNGTIGSGGSVAKGVICIKWSDILALFVSLGYRQALSCSGTEARPENSRIKTIHMILQDTKVDEV
jgi:hypothetical protein